MVIETVSEDRTTLERVMASGFSDSLGGAYEMIGHFLGLLEESTATLIKFERSERGWYWLVVEVRKIA